MTEAGSQTQTTNNRGSRLVLLALIVLVVQFFVLTVGLTYRYVDQRAQLEAAAFESAEAQAAEAATTINRAFGGVMAIAATLANDLTVKSQPYDEVPERLREEIENRPDVDGLAVTFAPFVYDPDLRLYQHYIFKTPDGEFDTLDGATYDYTVPQGDDPDAPNTDWFRLPLENGATWLEPFFAAGAQKVLVEYAVPFFAIDNQNGQRIPGGVVTIDYDLRDARDLIASLELGSTGYGFLISAEGTFLAHPETRLVGRSSIFDLADEVEDEALRTIGERALTGEQFFAEIVDSVTNETSWVFVEPIVATDWALGIVLNQSEFMPDSLTTLREQILIVISTSLFLTVLVALIARIDRGRVFSLWLASATFSTLGVIVVGLIWVLAGTMPPDRGVIITDQTTQDRYLERYRNTLEPDQRPIEVPTGIFVQAVKFPDPISATINGYIWQRYADTIPEEIERGFILPQRTGEEITLEEIYRQEQGDETVIIWNIGVTLNQDFDPTRFPLDRRDIGIRVSPAELSRNVILTPDLDSFALISPQLLPGLDQELTINNWSITSSSYSYRSVTFNTNFALQNRVQNGDTPELYFTVNTQRLFLGPFIAYLLPGIVVALMMFAFLLSDREPGNNEEIVTTLNYSAALFFVVAVLHASLRDSVAAVGLVYLEVLYILLYMAIVTVSLNMFLIAKRPNFWLIRYQNNLIPKLLYWPLIIGTLVIATLLVFVYT